MRSYSWYILDTNYNLKMTISIINLLILLVGVGIAIVLTEYRLTNFLASSKVKLVNKDIDLQSGFWCPKDAEVDGDA